MRLDQIGIADANVNVSIYSIETASWLRAQLSTVWH